MVKFKRQPKNQPQTLAVNDTTITDSFGRPVEISDKRFIASNVIGRIRVGLGPPLTF